MSPNGGEKRERERKEKKGLECVPQRGREKRAKGKKWCVCVWLAFGVEQVHETVT